MLICFNAGVAMAMMLSNHTSNGSNNNHSRSSSSSSSSNDSISDFEACISFTTACFLENYHNLSSEMMTKNSSRRVEMLVTLMFDNEEKNETSEVIG